MFWQGGSTETLLVFSLPYSAAYSTLGTIQETQLRLNNTPDIGWYKKDKKNCHWPLGTLLLNILNPQKNYTINYKNQIANYLSKKGEYYCWGVLYAALYGNNKVYKE